MGSSYELKIFVRVLLVGAVALFLAYVTMRSCENDTASPSSPIGSPFEVTDSEQAGRDFANNKINRSNRELGNTPFFAFCRYGAQKAPSWVNKAEFKKGCAEALHQQEPNPLDNDFVPGRDDPEFVYDKDYWG